MSLALVFPGQGAQRVGMGRALAEAYPEARASFERADAAIGIDLSRIIFDGPADALTRTDIQQPAIVTVSLATLAVLDARGAFDGKPIAVVAGLSLGEYAALAAAGVIGFEDAVRLTHRRGELMQAASEAEPSGMCAVIALDPEACRRACEAASDVGVASVANVNGPGQVVIAGAAAALEKAGELCKQAGAKRVVPLKVAGAFHTPLMAPAAEGLAEALAEVELKAPSCPVVQNVCAEPVTDTGVLRRNLIDQLTHPVLWQKSVENMVAGGTDAFLEVGPGKTVSGMIKRIDAGAWCGAVGEPDDVEAFIAG